ncbi:hypothetical protein ACPXCP_40025, partial [Streptomyces sp. DT20]|uniref:hypothetical protein n=1 Tax=Streptomyces sp. DT20 TaxID=3416519 RepID=UPI003CEC9FCA
SGYCCGKPQQSARIAQAQFEFRRKRRNGIPQAEFLKGIQFAQARIEGDRASAVTEAGYKAGCITLGPV